MPNSQTSFGMIEKQLKPRGIHDSRILEGMSKIPRHRFLEEALGGKAYYDCSLPIGGKQTISKPFMVAFMLQSLEIKGNERVLDIGTGSGYQAAVLSRICKSVYSVERIFKLATKAKKLFDELGYDNISVKVGDGYWGWKEYAPYDAIVVAASAAHLPNPLLNQLRCGGKLIIPISTSGGEQRLMMYEKHRGGLSNKILTECTFVEFVNC